MYLKSAIDEYIKFNPEEYVIEANGRVLNERAFSRGMLQCVAIRQQRLYRTRRICNGRRTRPRHSALRQPSFTRHFRARPPGRLCRQKRARRHHSRRISVYNAQTPGHHAHRRRSCTHGFKNKHTLHPWHSENVCPDRRHTVQTLLSHRQASFLRDCGIALSHIFTGHNRPF